MALKNIMLELGIAVDGLERTLEGVEIDIEVETGATPRLVATSARTVNGTPAVGYGAAPGPHCDYGRSGRRPVGHVEEPGGRLENRLGAGTGAALVVAWLEGHEERRSLDRAWDLRDGVDFGVRFAGLGVVA